MLFNKKNSYSFQFEAQVKMGAIEQLNARAVLCYSESGIKSTAALVKGVTRKVEWHLKIFTNRIDALNWLEAEQENITKKMEIEALDDRPLLAQS